MCSACVWRPYSIFAREEACESFDGPDSQAGELVGMGVSHPFAKEAKRWASGGAFGRSIQQQPLLDREGSLPPLRLSSCRIGSLYFEPVRALS